MGGDMKLQIIPLLLILLIAIPKMSYAECKEYKIVDHGDQVEAVCSGESITESQKNDLEKQNYKEKIEAQELELNRLKSEINNQGRTINQQLTTETNILNSDKVDIETYDIKYIPSNKPIRNGIQAPGEYSVKITAKNNGRKGYVRFKMKQVDFAGYETESISFSEQFDKDEYKIVTTHLPARQVPFIQSSNWIIETFK
jgi:hypothetical protein